jgi:hypothetical protein
MMAKRNVLDLSKIRAVIKEGRVQWTKHAALQALSRQIQSNEALDVILHGRILEQHPYAKPLSKCLMLGFVRQSEPLYVSLAYDSAHQSVIIITAHWFDPRKWVDPWTRRR